LGRIVDERVRALTNLDQHSIEALPDCTTEELQSDAKTKIYQYHDVLSSGDHLIAVQGVRFGFSTKISQVDGFVLLQDGSRRPLEEREKWQFL
jgi:hypothetical protein